MRRKTLELLDALRRQRSLKVSQDHLVALATDVQLLGSGKFVEQALTAVAPAKKSPTPKKVAADPFVTKIKRYQKRTGLTAAEFLRSLQSEIGSSTIGKKVPVAATKSLPKFLSFAREKLSDATIERACGAILERHV